MVPANIFVIFFFNNWFMSYIAICSLFVFTWGRGWGGGERSIKPENSVLFFKHIVFTNIFLLFYSYCFLQKYDWHKADDQKCS